MIGISENTKSLLYIKVLKRTVCYCNAIAVNGIPNLLQCDRECNIATDLSENGKVLYSMYFNLENILTLLAHEDQNMTYFNMK